VDALANILVLAASEGGGKEEGGSFLVTPGVGLMIWTLIAFGATFFILKKYAFPKIAEALDKRRVAIEESIAASEQARKEADDLLAEYRSRLREAREQADQIVARARKASESFEAESRERAKADRDEMMERTRDEIAQETRRALDEIRKEVANLTVIATEKVTRKTLDGDDHKRLIEEALAEVDFSAFSGEESRN
jgi:F-type H+-transporting ATPase subunit b